MPLSRRAWPREGGEALRLPVLLGLGPAIKLAGFVSPGDGWATHIPLLRDFAIKRLDARPAPREGAGLVLFADLRLCGIRRGSGVLGGLGDGRPVFAATLEFWTVLQENGPDFDMSLEFWVVFGADFGRCSE